MQRDSSPIPSLASAVLVGAAAVGIMAWLCKSSSARSTTPARSADPVTRRSSLRSTSTSSGQPRGARAPYAQALSDTGNAPDERPAGTPAPPEDGKRASAIGDTFSAGTASEVTASADNKGGMGQGGR